MSQSHILWRIYRASAGSQLAAPLRVRSVGSYQVSPSWVETPNRKWFLQLFWCVEGQGLFALGKERYTLCPGQIFIYRPGDLHDIKCLSNSWTYCWLTMDHPDCVRWIESFGLTQRLAQPGPCPEALFRQIADQLQDCTPEGERQASLLAYQLLLQTTHNSTNQPDSPLTARAKSYLDEHFDQPSLSINTLSDKLQVHRSTLFRSFTARYGLTPSQYLQNLRVRKALSLLQRRDLQIQEVARLSGFTDANYFSRVIHQAVGMSPRAFRNGS